MNEKLIYIDDDNLESISNKLNLKINEEKELYNDFNDCYNDIKNIYKSEQNELEMIESELLLNIRKMTNNHDNNVFLIKQRIKKVKEVKQKVKSIDESISIGRIIK